MSNDIQIKECIIFYPDIWFKVIYYPKYNDDNTSVYWIDYSVYRIESLDEDDPTNSDIDPELYMSGFIKWDGCTEFSIERVHECGLYYVRQLQKLLERLYEESSKFFKLELKDLE